MAEIRNRQTGEAFQVDDDRVAEFARWPSRYETVDTYPCPDCDETFDSPQKLGGHARSHAED